MTIKSDVSELRSISVAFTNLFDATTFGRTVSVTTFEERQLRSVLAAVQDYGFILPGDFAPALPDYGFLDVIEYLRRSVGEPFVDAAMAAGHSVTADESTPVALLPVWEFEPQLGNEDIFVSSASLRNSDLLVEALRVEDDDNPIPVPGVRARFERWSAAAGGVGRRLKTVRLPGREGSYVLFAAAAPA